MLRLIYLFIIIIQESSTDEVAEVTSKLSTIQLEKVSASPPALKLPQLFSLTPNSSGKSGNLQRRQVVAPQTNQVENLSDRKSLDQPLSNNHLNNTPQGLPHCTVLSSPYIIFFPIFRLSVLPNRHMSSS